MIRLLCAVTLVVVVTLVIVAGMTFIGLGPLMIFDDAISETIKGLARRVIA